MSNSAIILAGGFSSRFGQDKGLIQLAGKPLINHVLERITNVVDEKIVVVSSKIQAENYQKAVDSKVNILVDKENMHGPLVGALTGLEEAHGIHALLLPCDTPLLSKEILSLLLELCVNKAAVIPRWPNCYIEPLQAAYATEPASEAARNALGEGKMTMQSMVDRLQGVRYVSTLVLQQFDPELKTFFNVNTPLDLKKAELIFKREKD